MDNMKFIIISISSLTTVIAISFFMNLWNFNLVFPYIPFSHLSLSLLLIAIISAVLALRYDRELQSKEKGK
jgi:hypothetical protein